MYQASENMAFSAGGRSWSLLMMSAGASRPQRHAQMAADGHTKRRILVRSMRYGLPAQPALLVRGSSRRIMTLRFRPAYIRVINRRYLSTARSISERQSSATWRGSSAWPCLLLL